MNLKEFNRSVGLLATYAEQSGEDHLKEAAIEAMACMTELIAERVAQSITVGDRVTVNNGVVVFKVTKLDGCLADLSATLINGKVETINNVHVNHLKPVVKEGN